MPSEHVTSVTLDVSRSGWQTRRLVYTELPVMRGDMIIITLFVLLVVLVIAFALADDIGVQARRRELRKRISEIDTQLDYIDSEIESRAKEIEACKREQERALEYLERMLDY